MGFAFTELLGFRLLPRLKKIGSIRLRNPEHDLKFDPETRDVIEGGGELD